MPAKWPSGVVAISQVWGDLRPAVAEREIQQGLPGPGPQKNGCLQRGSKLHANDLGG